MEHLDSMIDMVSPPTSYEELDARRTAENAMYRNFFKNDEVEVINNDNENYSNYFK